MSDPKWIPTSINSLNRDRMEEIESEPSRLAARKRELEHELALLQSPVHEKARQPLITIDSQIELILQMFRCRESVYPKLWENRAKRTSGDSLTYDNEWIKGVCGKPPNGRVKCSEFPNQALSALDKEAARAHLIGQVVLETYAIREDDTCVFLACDFDGQARQADAFLFTRWAASEGLEPSAPSLGRRASWSACVNKIRTNLTDVTVLN